MALRGLVVPIAGDPRGLLRAFKQSERAAHTFSREIRQTGVSAQQSARLQVQAAVKTDARLREQIGEYKRLGSAAARGSREQVAAARLAAQAQGRLAHSTAVSARESRHLAAASARAQRGVGQIGRGAIAGSGALRGLGRSLAFAAGGYLGAAGLVYGIKASISASAQFDNSLRKIIGLAGGSEKGVKAFRGQLLALGPAVGKSPQELAEALYFVASAGVDASKQMGVVKVSAQAASAGLGETQVVADAVTSAMNAYGAVNLSAAQATDVLVATVKEGKGEAAAFAPVIGTVASFAAQLGVSFNDVGAALAAQTRLGIPASKAAIQLQALFSGLVKVTPQAEKAFHAVGLSGAGLRKELKEKGLLAVLRTLKERFGDNTVAMAQAFPNIRAIRALFGLIGKQGGETAKIFERMADSSGSLKTAFGAVSKDTAFQFARFNAAVKVSEVLIGAALAPAAAKAAAAIANWLGKTRNQQRLQRSLNSAVRTGGQIFRGVVAVLRPMAHVLVRVSHALGGAANTAKVLFAAFVGLRLLRWVAQFRALSASIRGVAAAEVLAGGAGGKGLLTRLGRTALLAAGLRGGAVGGAAALGAGGLAGAAGVAGAVLTLGGGSAQGGDRRSKYRRMYALVDRLSKGAKPNSVQQAALSALRGRPIFQAPDKWIAEGEAILASNLRGNQEGAGAARAGSPHGFTTGGTVARGGGGGGAAAGAGGGGGGGGGGRASALAVLQEQLAKAELTASTRDDRARLVQLAALTRQKISKSKNLKDRTQLYQELGGYESQIAQIDKEGTDKVKAAHKKQVDALKEREKTLKSRIQEITGQFKEAIGTAREGIGQLFGGPILNPADDPAKAKQTLGVTNQGATAKNIIADLRAQTAQSKRFQRDINRVVGGSGLSKSQRNQLRKELTEGGPGTIGTLEGLLKGGPGALKEFGKAFAGREAQAQAVGTVNMRSRLVQLHAARVQLRLTRAAERRLGGGGGNVTINVNGARDPKQVARDVRNELQKASGRTAAQRRGRHEGSVHGVH